MLNNDLGQIRLFCEMDRLSSRRQQLGSRGRCSVFDYSLLMLTLTHPNLFFLVMLPNSSRSIGMRSVKPARVAPASPQMRARPSQPVNQQPRRRLWSPRLPQRNAVGRRKMSRNSRRRSRKQAAMAMATMLEQRRNRVRARELLRRRPRNP